MQPPDVYFGVILINVRKKQMGVKVYLARSIQAVAIKLNYFVCIFFDVSTRVIAGHVL